MSRKDFVALAAEIAQIVDVDARRSAAYAVAVACQKLNPRFDFTKFYEACGAV